MVFYPMLERELAGRGIKKKVVAESIGVTYRSLNNKLSGRVPFTWPEVSTIRSRFFPDMAPDVLFSPIDERYQGYTPGADKLIPGERDDRETVV